MCRLSFIQVKVERWEAIALQAYPQKSDRSEREALWQLIPSIQGLVIGDKGYLSEPLQVDLKQEQQIHLETALRHNMIETRSPQYLRLLKKMRRLIETVIGQLCERFEIEKV